MKKILAASLHTLALLLLLLSLILLHFSSEGSLLSVLRQPDYFRSDSFESEFSEAVSDIFDYIDLRALFEKNGALNLNQVVAQAEERGTPVSYTLNYLIRYARSMGYYLNAKNEIQLDERSATISPMEDEKEHPIRITFRAYMPDYKPLSPADGLSSLGKLAQETLGYLAKYYAVRAEFFDQDSNLKFSVRYTSGEKSMLYTNAADMTEAEICALGSFLSTDSDSLAVRSNLRTAPANIPPLLQARNPYADGSYTMAVGVNRTLPAADAFSDAAQRYESSRVLSAAGLFLLLGSLLLAGGSYVWLLLLTGKSAERKGIVLYPADHAPLELLFLLFLLWFLWTNRLAPVFLDSLVLVIGELRDTDFWIALFRFLFCYLLFVPLSLSLVRAYKARTLWKASLLRRLSELVRCYTESAAQTAPRFYSLLLFVLPNLLGILLFLLLFLHFLQNRSLRAFFTALALLCILALIDFYSWRITAGLSEAVGRQVRAERLRTDLITNVSHDLKTPLTSILNYVELLKREELDNPRAQEYLEILEQKSGRLKTLTEDLVEASKASSGSITMNFTELDYGEMIQQALGEFEDKLSAAKLTIVETLPPEPLMIVSDGRHLWRIIENLLNNCCKYALRGSRVYIDVYRDEDCAVCTIKNISASPLNITPEELTERFVRGDVSRSTEGSGLGLSIAKSLSSLMKGELRIEIDGDLYKASVRLPLSVES